MREEESKARRAELWERFFGKGTSEPVGASGSGGDAIRELEANLEDLKKQINQGGGNKGADVLKRGVEAVLGLARTVAKKPVGERAEMAETRDAEIAGRAKVGNLTWSKGKSNAGQYPPLWSTDQKVDAGVEVESSDRLSLQARRSGA